MPVNLIFFPIYAAKLKPKFGSKMLTTPGLLKLFSVEHPSGLPTFLNFCFSPTQQMLTGLQLTTLTSWLPLALLFKHMDYMFSEVLVASKSQTQTTLLLS